MLKNQLLKSCALALVLGTFSWGAHAVITYDEDELSQKTTPALPNLEAQRPDLGDVEAVEIPHGAPAVSALSPLESFLGELGRSNPIRAALLSHLEPRDVLKLSVTSRAMNVWVGKEAIEEARKIEVLRAQARDTNERMNVRLDAAAALPLEDKERNQLLLAWALDPRQTIYVHIDAALALPPQDEKRNQLLLAWAQGLEQGVSLRIQAAAALPLENEGRNQVLRAIARDPSKYSFFRISAAADLPRQDAERNQLLRALALDPKQETQDRMEALKSLASSLEEFNQMLRERVWDPNERLYFRIDVAIRFIDGPDKKVILQHLREIEAQQRQ